MCTQKNIYACTCIFLVCFCGMARLESRTVNRGWHAILHMMLSISLHHAWWLASLAKILQAKNHASLAKASCIHTGACTWPLFWRHVFSRPNRPNRNVMVWDLPHRLLTSLGSWLGCRSRFIASCSHRSFFISDRSRRCRRSHTADHDNLDASPSAFL